MLVNPARADAMAQRSPASRSLMEDGYTILRDALPVPTIEALSADLDPRFYATPFCEGGFYGARTKRFGRLLIRSRHMAALVMHPDILTLAEAALGPWCDRFQLNLTQAIEIHPGALAQFPHRDQDMWAGALGETEYLINVMWPLTAFTEANGATLIWPRSHGLEALVEEPKEAPVVAEAEPGDAIVFLGSTLHGAGGNRSLRVRRGIIVSYCLGWLKPYENQWLAYPPGSRKPSRPSSLRSRAMRSTGRTSAISKGNAPRCFSAAIRTSHSPPSTHCAPTRRRCLPEHIAKQQAGRGQGTPAA